jgi:periplasmic divalent cation tolerance protein
VVVLTDTSATAVRMAWIPCPDEATARRIAGRAVELHLAACGNILPQATSIYRWEGEIRCESEAILVLKTVHARIESLTELVRSLHPYELPAISFLDVDSGHPPFLRWVASESSTPPV